VPTGTPTPSIARMCQFVSKTVDSGICPLRASRCGYIPYDRSSQALKATIGNIKNDRLCRQNDRGSRSPSGNGNGRNSSSKRRSFLGTRA
jgi:hypothetical protein